MFQVLRVLARWSRQRRHAWLRLRLRRISTRMPPLVEAPLRSSLFNVEQMERHGQALAHLPTVHSRRSRERLLGRLAENEALLGDAFTLLTAMVQEDIRITPAGEWLLDNYHLVEEQIHTARRHLPEGYSRQLPSLTGGSSAGLPRVYALSLEVIAHGDGRIDGETISRFIAAYQTIAPLKLGELWAIPIMLRLALIDNLRRMAVRVVHDGGDRRQATAWAAQLNQTAARSPKDVVLVVADLARSQPPLSGAFVSELARGLQGRGGVFAMPITWLEQSAAADGHRIEELVHLESQQQAADQVSISNSIGSLRSLASMDWRDFVETMSVVEHSLRQDPALAYPVMDFSTRDRYRHVVERIARRGHLDERHVADTALALAQAAAHTTPRAYQAHIGFYLIDDGVAQLTARLSASASVPVRVRSRRSSLLAYLLPIAVVVGVLGWGLLVSAPTLPSVWQWVAGALAVLAFSELGIVLVNWAATVLIVPQRLPRMDYAQGIPVHSRTLVVVPSLLGSEHEVDTLVEALEVRFLANRDPHLHFALLTDFLDADQATLPTDAALLESAARQIAQLNQRYLPARPRPRPRTDADADADDIFFLLHRPREWNSSEHRWMGHERKRGKLAALNRLLRESDTGAFMRITGNVAVLAHVRYVITLDADTRLPRDAARELVATLAHPLNQAHFDADLRRVVRGYGILQPSVGTRLGGQRSSRYARMFGSEGVSIRTRTLYRMCTRTCSVKALSSARASTTLRPSSWHWLTVSRTTAFSAMTCWKGATRVPG